MRPIPQTKLHEVLTPIFEQRIAESNAEGRATVEHALTQLLAGYASLSISAFVDDLENPKSCLIVGLATSYALLGPMAVVHLLWVAPEHRGDAAAEIADMFKTAEGYASMNGALYIQGASWVYQGAEGMDALWGRQGFDLQEKVFVKLLNEEEQQ